MKKIKQYKYIILIVILILGFIFYKNIAKSWMLSIYGGGVTIMRLDYSSKEDCLSAGRSYLADRKGIERFDCGYKCHSFDKNNLQDSPLCKQVCNQAGCR
ncbi:MAG: hypothetical protein NTV77_01890 [Candidatus Azambacteria bacterium]|nr:hypothetical protein [Candidatus Azambacteria bacterium]